MAKRATKRGAIFEVRPELVVAGLKAINALPAEAECHVEEWVLVKAYSPRLPEVPEGEEFPRRVAAAGQSLGQEV